MAKKKKHKPRPGHRNAAPTPPRAPRAPRAPEEKLDTERLAYTALGAAGTALVGGFLAKQDWSPKVIATALTAVGGAMAAAGKTGNLQAVGTGAFGAGGGQLALLMMDDRYDRAVQEAQKLAQSQRKGGADKRQADTSGLPPGALESAFERARAHLAITADDYELS
jgi:hypothetical protein